MQSNGISSEEILENAQQPPARGAFPLEFARDYAPVRTIRSADPFRTPESAELKRGFVYGLLEPGTRRLIS